MKFLALRAFSAVPEFFSYSYPLFAFNGRFLWRSGTSPFTLSTAVCRNVRARLLYSLALVSSYDCKRLKKCLACALFLSKNSIQCINVIAGMTYNSPWSLDTISLLLMQQTILSTPQSLYPWQPKQNKHPALPTLRTQSTPVRQLLQLLQRLKTNKRAIT
jgi:hypothetical protein